MNTEAPTVVSTEPTEGGNLTAQIVKVKFNDFLSHESVTPSSDIRLLDAGDNPIAGGGDHGRCRGDRNTLHRLTLAPGPYRLVVTTDVEDLAGNALSQALPSAFASP